MKRHPLDLVSLVLGIAFLGVGLPFLIREVNVLDLDAGWLRPFGLGLVAVLALAALRPRRKSEN